jgi:hypothetical protein
MVSGTNPGPLAPYPLFTLRFSVAANPLAPDWLDAYFGANAWYPNGAEGQVISNGLALVVSLPERM